MKIIFPPFFFFFKGRKSEAEKYFVKAIQLDPTKGNCYMHYGTFRIDRVSTRIPDLLLISLSD